MLSVTLDSLKLFIREFGYSILYVGGIDKTPVVYAVEDTYQITFTTQAKGEAWVVIGGVEYSDTYAGYRQTESDIHTDDGIQYYALSDNHLASKAPAAATSYWGNQLDFLIALGDSANWIDNKEELTQILYLASDITKGEIPVLYARGNHETKGILADQYHNYVAASGENFYYTFRLKNNLGRTPQSNES